MLPKDLLQPRQRLKDFFYGVVVGFLTGGKSGFIHAVIDVVINPAVELVDFSLQCGWIVIPGFRAQRIKRSVKHTDDICRFVADNGVVLFVPQHRNGHPTAVVRIGV